MWHVLVIYGEICDINVWLWSCLNHIIILRFYLFFYTHYQKYNAKILFQRENQNHKIFLFEGLRCQIFFLSWLIFHFSKTRSLLHKICMTNNRHRFYINWNLKCSVGISWSTSLKLNRLTSRRIILHSDFSSDSRKSTTTTVEDELNAIWGTGDVKPRPIWLRS